MRLIDADLLKQNCKITGEFDNHFQCVDLITLGSVIDHQPPAYDVNAVVSEIRKKQRDAMSVKANMDVNKDFYKGLEYGYEIAIDVVRNGGVK